MNKVILNLNSPHWRYFYPRYTTEIKRSLIYRIFESSNNIYQKAEVFGLIFIQKLYPSFNIESSNLNNDLIFQETFAPFDFRIRNISNVTYTFDVKYGSKNELSFYISDPELNYMSYNPDNHFIFYVYHDFSGFVILPGKYALSEIMLYRSREIHYELIDKHP